MPLTIASKSIKYLVINLIKCVQDFYTKKCQTLLRKTEESHKWYSMLIYERLNVVIMPDLSNWAIDLM